MLVDRLSDIIQKIGGRSIGGKWIRIMRRSCAIFASIRQVSYALPFDVIQHLLVLTFHHYLDLQLGRDLLIQIRQPTLSRIHFQECLSKITYPWRRHQCFIMI